MSEHLIEIDVALVAKRVAADPRNARFSVIEQWAVCQWVNDRLAEIEATTPERSISASLAATVATVLARFDRHAELQVNSLEEGGLNKFEALVALEQSLMTLRTQFNEEFPR